MRVRACRTTDLRPGGALRVGVPDHAPIALFNVEGTFHATDDLCTHGFSSLAEDGTIVGDEIECGWHGGRFAIATGEPTANPCTEALRVYRVEVIDDDVFVIVL